VSRDELTSILNERGGRIVPVVLHRRGGGGALVSVPGATILVLVDD